MKNIPVLLLLFMAISSCNGSDKAQTDHSSTPPPATSTDQTDPNSPPNPVGQISAYVRRVFQDKSGNLWFGTNGDGVCNYDGTGLAYFTPLQGFCGDAVRGMVEDENRNIWFATSGGICRYDPSAAPEKAFTGYTTSDGLLHSEVWSILRDRTGGLWFGTEAGVSRYDPSVETAQGKKGTFTDFPLPAADLRRYPDAYPAAKLVSSMYQDRAGNIWLGTNGNGVYHYDGSALTQLSEKDGLCNNVIQCILEDRSGNIWIGTRFGGLSRYDPVTKSFTTFTEKDGLCSTFVWTMIEDKAGNLWFGTAGGGTCRYDPRTKSFTSFSAQDGLPLTHVQSIMEDNKGTLWFGCSGGLYRRDGDRFVNITKQGPW